uniref:Uncharacterized protein n=1 Tax=Romanomermis culicivorax TaxID=13658 RepID=A0A915K3N7_ROMCU
MVHDGDVLIFTATVGMYELKNENIKFYGVTALSTYVEEKVARQEQKDVFWCVLENLRGNNSDLIITDTTFLRKPVLEDSSKNDPSVMQTEENWN